MQIRRRAYGDGSRFPASLHPVLRRIYAARGVVDGGELVLQTANLLPPDTLLGLGQATTILAAAIAAQRRIVIAGDYDADGATATAVAVLGLRALGAASVDYVVPNRFSMGYGLSPALVELACARHAQVLVTVDNGIASLAGVAAAQAVGLQVVITDHHLAGPDLPQADAIVNPNQPGCGFASKHLAGVGVMFYVLLALRAQLRADGAFVGRREPNLADLLDLVALGTVADVVRLDYNNRILVAQGIARIRAGHARPGLLALLQLAGRNRESISSAELGFVLGPRINAAGRLTDMRVGIECLLAETLEAARPLAAQLDALNRERRGIQAQMHDEALELAHDNQAVGVCLFDPGWHEGVVGLAASRIKDRLGRPVIAFARASEDGLLKGSGRSIAGLHLRDVLAMVDAQHPGMIVRFGGHAMAAGLTLAESSLADFSAAFDARCRELLDPADLDRIIETDGELAPEELQIETAHLIEQAGPWGQGFPQPLFEGVFEVRELRRIGEDGRHARYRLAGPGGTALDAVHFNAPEEIAAGSRVNAVYQLVINRYRGLDALEVRVEHLHLV